MDRRSINKMNYGACYYPEHWPEERWETDLKLMKEANINVIRIGEFAWDKMEPEDGKYDFQWLDKVIKLFSDDGIKIMMCTPTATPPKWLMDKHPDIYQQNKEGVIKKFGSRRHYCLNNENYIRATEKIVSELADRYGSNPAIIAWQIDNEFGTHNSTRCYCKTCETTFKKWLKKKYERIDDLNQAWGTYFWSQTYRSFDQVILPMYTTAHDSLPDLGSNSGLEITGPSHVHNPGLMLDYARFASDATVSYNKLQKKILKAKTNAPVTHNLADYEFDFYDLGKDLDFACYDAYSDLGFARIPFQGVGMMQTIIRGVKEKNYWIAEQQSGPAGWNTIGNTPSPGKIRLWAYQSIAHGAEAILYFRWRACTVGIEQYWYGILDHDGIPKRRYSEIKSIGKEFQLISELIVDSSVDADVAVVMSFDNLWSHAFQSHNNKFDYIQTIGEYYTAFMTNGVTTDICSIDTDFNKYKLIVLPAFNLMTEEIKNKLEDYVEKGGRVLITYRSGTREWNNSMTTQPLPGYFQKLTGIIIEEFDSINTSAAINPITMKQKNRKVKIKGISCQPQRSSLKHDLLLVLAQLLPITGKASIWCDVINPVTATILATYNSGFYKDKAAITCNDFGKGKVYYFGSDLDVISLITEIRGIIHENSIQQITHHILDDIEIVRKKSAEGKTFYIICNHGVKKRKVKLTKEVTNALTRNFEGNTIKLKPFDAAVVTTH